MVLLAFSIASAAYAGSATWLSNPASGDWNTNTNWTAGGPPGTGDTATFATSSVTSVSFSAGTQVGAIVFNSGASAFTISVPGNVTFIISGAGITNNSSNTQNFAADGAPAELAEIDFNSSATSGSSTHFAVNGPALVNFNNTSSAASGSFAINGNPSTGNSGQITFNDGSDAGSGTFALAAPAQANFHGTSKASAGNFTLNTEPSHGYNSQAILDDTATAGSGTFTANGATVNGDNGSIIKFDSSSTAATATLIAHPGGNGGNGGMISLISLSTGGTARVEVFGAGTGDQTDGNLDISSHGGGVTIGSIEGSGSVFLGQNNLTVGMNNRSTIFSGMIADYYFNNTGGVGSLTKVGKGKLTLTKGNLYTGGTTIVKGMLVAKNKTGSATGSGNVQVNSGTLSGTGKIDGAITVGNGTTSGPVLLPGTATKPGALTINNTLTFNSPATYKCTLNRTSSPPAMSKVNAMGVTINSGATFRLLDPTTGSLTTGTSFLVINNTSANPIAGTFNNLADGGTIASGGSTFKASYTGGTGNDLTLTVQ